MKGWNRHAQQCAVGAAAVSKGACASVHGRAFFRGKVAGQALILVVVSLLVLCLGLVVLFDTGQVVTKKVQLVNTADAAAYSAAVQEARALNLIAYMNRASVANEVAMAQMVSWYSWTNFAISATDHLADALGVIALVTSWAGVGEAIAAATEALEEAKSDLEAGRNVEQQLFNVASAAVADLNGVYSKVSLVVADGGAADAANVARNVVTLNDPQASIPAMGIGILAQNTLAANAYVTRYTIPNASSGSAGAERLKNVVMEARDPFSRQRDGSFLFGWIKKYGGTDLANYHSWVGLDTLDIEFTCPVVPCGMEGFPPHLKHFDTPIAWGGAAAVDTVSTSFAALARQDPGWNGPYQGNDPQYAQKQPYAAYSNALNNGAASGMALSQPAEDGTPWITPELEQPGATVGLPDYNDIVANKATVPYDNGKSASADGVSAVDVGPVFSVLVAQVMNTVQTSSNVKGIGGPPDFQVTDTSVANGMTALASAQTYFSRPRSLFPRLTDPGRETGSLFSPYWQARLIDTPCTTRQEVAVSNGAAAPCVP
ncbi:pilus assembly protein TadG-related protein [Dyella mobilis]|uniref:Putative Flp pilus-assembly TadG-like N-terminal domain-containing protein n=1 Tax=Dyella mobilis TaxID=1849582 RepID=A0ABS2KKW1_9GAMM|nr:pilus assembly protein TadG-related protein [Dyella mobilis]MBM7131533.1 hypothetical protein [Dyella mobilis]GLQ96496.1 hypothetical protein GCM10007863_09140 [Dyella mobilis]